MLTIFAGLLAGWVMLHPGHSTRVELQWNGESQSIELAMRIDHADLETALRKRLGRAVAVERLTDEQAERWVGDYLCQTLRIDGERLTKERFAWVGWERKRISSWIYAELPIGSEHPETVALTILTLLDVEPELNHVVTLRGDDRQQSVVLSKAKSVVKIPIGR